MKKLFTVLFFTVLFMTTAALAEPFLVCDPQTNVTHYIITGDIDITIPATDLGDGTVRLAYDLESVLERRYDIQVKAKNVWGESVVVPFDFTKAIPDVPGGVRIE